MRFPVLGLVLFVCSACGDDSLGRVEDDEPVEEPHVPTCGDGVVEGAEVCDDGPANRVGWALNRRCNTACDGDAPWCGDGRVDAGHEGCDDAGTSDGNGCSAVCEVEVGFHCAFAPSICAPLGFGIVPPATFTMGSPAAELGRDADEPQTVVTLTRAVAFAETEVTQQQFTALVGWNPSQLSSCGGSCPVEGLSWYDALAYANRRSVAEGFTPCYVLNDIVCTAGGGVGSSAGACFDGDATSGGISSAAVTLNGVMHPKDCVGYRLPTEAEWEHAARAGTTSATFAGEIGTDQSGCPSATTLDSVAWFCANAANTTRPVRGKRANPWGLYDVLGNVWEWTWDRYGDYAAGPLVDPVGPAEGGPRTSRGASYISQTRSIRAASRSTAPPDDRQPFRGLRVVRTLPQ